MALASVGGHFEFMVPFFLVPRFCGAAIDHFGWVLVSLSYIQYILYSRSDSGGISGAVCLAEKTVAVPRMGGR